MSKKNEIKKQTPDWLCERFYENTVKPCLEKNNTMTMEWCISKQTLVATLNYLRNEKKLVCEWQEIHEGRYTIKISKQKS